MALNHKLDSRTATAEQSIWSDIPEDDFRSHLVMLQEKTNSVPIRPELFPLTTGERSLTMESYTLSVYDEQSLADDFAYIAAIGEGAQSVAAVCVEEHHLMRQLIIRFAAADAIDNRLKVSLEEVGQIFMSSAAAMTDIKSTESEMLLSKITALHTQKILGRLRSKKWQKPTYLVRSHKKSLWQDLDNLIHRVPHVYTKKNHPVRAAVVNELQQLQSHLEYFESISGDDSISILCVVNHTYQFCKSKVMTNFAAKLESIPKPTQQVSAALKTIQQIEKIGAYERIANDLLEKAKRYPDLFRNIKFEYLRPYASIPTAIGFERWAKTIHVHAEIQLVIYYDILASQQMQTEFLSPRTIGTSKYLCYLCFLFIKHHGRFQPVNTHGRLYDQWTIPDLLEFVEDNRQKYMAAIKSMDREIIDLANQLEPKQRKRDVWRVEPMTSRQNLLLSTPAPADTDLNNLMHGCILQPA